MLHAILVCTDEVFVESGFLEGLENAMAVHFSGGLEGLHVIIFRFVQVGF